MPDFGISVCEVRREESGNWNRHFGFARFHTSCHVNDGCDVQSIKHFHRVLDTKSGRMMTKGKELPEYRVGSQKHRGILFRSYQGTKEDLCGDSRYGVSY